MKAGCGENETIQGAAEAFKKKKKGGGLASCELL